MKFCKQCGSELSTEAKFCKNCGAQVISSDSSEETVKNATAVAQDKPPKKVPKWAIGVGAAVLLTVAGIAGVMALNNGGEKKTIETVAEPKEEVDSKPPSISQDEVTTLFPDWQLSKEEILRIHDSYYNVLVIANNEVEFEEKVKIAVIDYDGKAETNKWSTVWESEEHYADPIFDIDSYIGDLYVVNPEESKVAMIVYNVMHGGSARTYETYAVQLDKDGTGTVIWSGNGSFIEQEEEYIEVMTHGAVQLSVDKKGVIVTEIPRSEVGSDDSLQIEFVLDSEGLVIPTEDEEVYVKIGQPITFVPANNDTKKLFDEGKIALYYNSMDQAPISTSNANLVYAGNEFSLTEEGDYGFLLDYYEDGEDFTTPPYTFIVHIGDGVKPTESKKEEEEVSASTDIDAPFPLGAPLSELKAHYGEPTYDDYYSGARLVTFDKEGYFIDELEETVMGYFFAAPTISVFGATVGMTAEEINKVLAESVEPSISELSGEYILPYYKNGYKIFFELETKDGPTKLVRLVRE
ncbi:zinc-ribbon domain-containing protein [Ferdinandcohnia sp. Marseille-Q9671]